jgi:hypothetical protein
MGSQSRLKQDHKRGLTASSFAVWEESSFLACRQASRSKERSDSPPQKKIVIERKYIRALEAQLKRWPPKKCNSREEKK